MNRQKGQLYEVYASKGLLGRLASTLPKLGSTRRLNNKPSIGKKPRKLPKAPNISPEDAINADGDDTIFDGTDREMPDPKKFARNGVRNIVGQVPAGRRSGAGPIRQQGVKKFGTPETRKLARDIVKRKFRPLRSRNAGEIFTESDLVSSLIRKQFYDTQISTGRVGGLLRRQFSAFMDLSPEERRRRTLENLRSRFGYTSEDKDQIDELLDSTYELEEMKSRIDEKAHTQVRNVIENAVADSPAFRRVVEEQDFPDIVVIDRLSERLIENFYDDQGLERPEDGLGDDVSAFAYGEMIYFMGNQWDDWHTPDGKRNDEELEEDPEEIERMATTAESTLRHEYGHILNNRIYSSGSKDQYNALLSIHQDYLDTAALWSDFQRRRFEIMESEGEEAANNWARSAAERYDIPRVEDIWWSTYAEEDEDEFFAELFTMATSPVESIRNRVPQRMRTKLTIILGFNPWEEFENA